MKKMVMFIIVSFYAMIIGSDVVNAELPDYVVVSNSVDVRVEPRVDSRIIIKLPIAHEVLLIKNKDKVRDGVRGIQGEWVYVDTRFLGDNHKETIKGWVFDYDLASHKLLKDRNNLKRISSFKHYKMDFKGWDQNRKWEIRPNGSFKYQYYSYESKSERGVARGHLYRHKDLIIAFLEPKGTITEYFYFKEDGSTLCCTWPDQNGEIICVEPLK
ncbi:MAG: hypothetical protein AB2L13_12390 [Spirochaetota bacterium]